jgi:hypothetical protein
VKKPPSYPRSFSLGFDPRGEAGAKPLQLLCSCLFRSLLCYHGEWYIVNNLKLETTINATRMLCSNKVGKRGRIKLMAWKAWSMVMMDGMMGSTIHNSICNIQTELTLNSPIIHVPFLHLHVTKCLPNSYLIVTFSLPF